MKKKVYTPGLFLIVLVSLIMPLQSLSDEAVLTAEDLNDSLKRMQRIQLEIETSDSANQQDLVFQLGIEADNLAILLTNEVILNNLNQRGLIDLAMDRTFDMGINYLWFPEKRRFVYDGAAFRKYLELAPEGMNAAESAYRLLEQEFFQSTGDDDVDTLVESAHRKQAYLNKYADNMRAPKVGILLAIDYRDIWRSYRGSGDQGNALAYSEKTRDQFQWIIETHPNAQESEIAKGLLQRFEIELEAYLQGNLADMEGG